MRVISPLLKRVVYPGLAKTGYFRQIAGAGPAVVTYHGVMPTGYKSIDPDLDGSLVTAESFRRQLQLLKSRYHVITPEEFRNWCRSKQLLPDRSVLLTCDDGLENCVTDMLPILQEFGVSCLFFVLGSSLGQQKSLLWYEELYVLLLAAPDRVTFDIQELGGLRTAAGLQEKRQLGSKLIEVLSAYDLASRKKLIENIRRQFGLPEISATFLNNEEGRRRFQMLNQTGLSKLISAGMTIGAHTNSHCMLSRAGDELAWAEIQSGRTMLATALNQPIWAFAYPFGGADSVTPRDLHMAEQAGFECAFVNTGGGFGAKIPPYAIPRVHVPAKMTIGEFEAHLSGFHRNLRTRLARGSDGRYS